MKPVVKTYILFGILALVAAFIVAFASKKEVKQVEVLAVVNEYPRFNHTEIKLTSKKSKSVKKIEKKDEVLEQPKAEIDFRKFSEVNIEDVLNEEIQLPETN